RSDDVVIDKLLENENQILHNPYIRRDQFFDAWAQHLYDDFFSVIPGPMDLSERCCSQRLRVERIEDRFNRLFQLGLNSFSNFGSGEGRNLIMKSRQFFNINLGNDVGANSEDLCQLDEARAKRSDTRGEFASSFMLHLIRYETWRSCHNPTPPVSKERNDERRQAE